MNTTETPIQPTRVPGGQPANEVAQDTVAQQELQIVNPDPKYGPITLIEPTTRGYLHVAAEVHPPRLPRLPFMPTGRAKSQLLAQLQEIASQLEQLDAVEAVTIFDALAMPPVARSPYFQQRADTIKVARFDVVVLIETTSPATAREVQNTAPYQALVEALRGSATQMHVIAARNVKRIGDVDKTRPGVFLFNYFVADNGEVMLRLWDCLAEWYAVETGLDNSTLLVPLEDEPSDYLAINNARWDESLLQVMFRQLSRKSFWAYVLANLEVNRVGAMPILYRRVTSSGQPLRAPWWMTAAGAAAIGAALVGRRWRRSH